MALTQKRRQELAEELDTASTWLGHPGRAGRLRNIAAELRGEEPDDDNAEAVQARLDEAEKAEAEAAEAKATKKAAAKNNAPQS